MLDFFFNDTATTEIYTLSLHDALPIYRTDDVVTTMDNHAGNLSNAIDMFDQVVVSFKETVVHEVVTLNSRESNRHLGLAEVDRKSTRLNSSHSQISYAVFCLKKKIKTK